MLAIRGKALGRKKPLFADWSIPLPPELQGDGVSLRDVVSRIVRHEVSRFKERQQQEQFLQALTARQIDEAMEKGRVRMGATGVPIQEVDEEAAVATALQAFEDGIYLVVIDDQEQPSLDAQVFLRPDSRITFVRLTLLAGG